MSTINSHSAPKTEMMHIPGSTAVRDDVRTGWLAGLLGKLTLRKVLLKIHLYIALWLGALLVLAGLTGSLLVYKHALDKWLNPELLQVRVLDSGAKPFLSLIEAANLVSPIKDPPSHLYLPRHEDDAMVVRYQIKHPDPAHKGHNHHFYEVMVNPYTGVVLGHRDRDDALMTIILQLHYKLLAGDTGKLVMGITALLTLILTLTGIYLWWPKLTKLKQAFVIKRNASSHRFNFDLHKTTGIYTALVMFVVALSGVYFNLPQVFKPVIGFFSPLTEIPRDVKSVPPADSELLAAITPEEAAQVAVNNFPAGIEAQRIFLPADATGVYMITARQPTEYGSNGKTLIWIDQYSGNILNIRDPHKLGAGDAFLNLQLPLHNGEILGDAGQIAVLIVGFSPLLLFITGVIVWLKKRRAKRVEWLRRSPAA